MEENRTEQRKEASNVGGEETVRMEKSVRKPSFFTKVRIQLLILLAAAVLVIIGAGITLTALRPERVAARYIRIMHGENNLEKAKSYLAYDYEKIRLYKTTEEEVFSETKWLYDADVENWKEYYQAYKEFYDDAYLDEYGKWKISCEATRSKNVSLSKIKKNYDNSFLLAIGLDLDGVREAREVTVKMKIAGEEDSKRFSYTVTMVRMGLLWKVIDWEQD